MSTSSVLKRCAFSVAVITFSGCGGSQSPLVSPKAIPEGPSVVTNVAHGRSLMPPAAKNDDLLYVSDGFSVYMYSYPEANPVGTFSLSGAAGMCPDKVGNVWITTFRENTIVEYAHGGATPIGGFNISKLGNPQSCAVDPASGDLAVVGYPLGSTAAAKVLVYPGASGKPKIYKVHLDTTSFCTYDDNGNLFVSGYAHGGVSKPFGVIALKKGTREFRRISFGKDGLSSYEARPIQWDEHFVTVGSTAGMVQYSIRGYRAVKEGETSFADLHGLYNAWIQGSKVVVVNIGGTGFPQVQIDRYPAGGLPIRTINDLPSGPFGVTVSLAAPNIRPR